ncbi:DUF3833 domain-containing protein [Pelagibius litoralis]|uniref:DUF3833 domain-containing protein n=2 Tax=Pelagibius litoralis TaxID=374515 RepID=A0A967F328_9PROT|nr:DUF3833 domain-containing protein [Pelagibius litoralis]
MVLLRCFAAILLLFTAGCSSMTPEQFDGREPRLLIEDYLAGETRAWGLFVDRFGNLRREFVVDITGTWDGKTLTLVEDFVYSDGEEQQRIWTINKLDDHRYEGTAADVIGTAEGVSYGNALNWRYTLALKVGDSIWNVHFDDWMFLQPDDVLMNRARVSKFGFDIGEVTIFFQKVPAQNAAALEGHSIAAE